MPMGLCNVAAIFQRLMNIVFQGMIRRELVVYLGDIIIVGSTLEQLLSNMSAVFKRLRRANLSGWLKPENKLDVQQFVGLKKLLSPFYQALRSNCISANSHHQEISFLVGERAGSRV